MKPANDKATRKVPPTRNIGGYIDETDKFLAAYGTTAKKETEKLEALEKKLGLSLEPLQRPPYKDPGDKGQSNA